MNGKAEEAQTALDAAKTQMKELSEKHSDYEHYPNLKGYFTTTSSFLEFCQNPTGSFEQLKDTINDYKNKARAISVIWTIFSKNKYFLRGGVIPAPLLFINKKAASKRKPPLVNSFVKRKYSLLEVSVEKTLESLAVSCLVAATLLMFYASGNVQKPLNPLFKPHL